MSICGKRCEIGLKRAAATVGAEIHALSGIPERCRRIGLIDLHAADRIDGEASTSS
jgi:hypothetical protein